MKKREFLKVAGMSGLGITAPAGVLTSDNKRHFVLEERKQVFNMSGYAAPKLDTVRIGYIGLGNRGSGAIKRIVHLENIEVVGVADILPDKADGAKKELEKSGQHPKTYSGSADAWKKLCDRKDVDLIYICTPWALHAPMALYAMEHGKHVAVEIPAALTVDECWKLVETSEKTKKHCMMLENCCYDFFELLTLNMARQGFFGEIVHVEGAYIHDIFDSLFQKEKRFELWRLKENLRNGNLYPTHGLGPVAQILDINRGDKMDYLVSMSCNDFMLQSKARELAATNSYFNQYAQKSFRGNMNTTTIKTNKGKTIMLQHDVSSPRPYSRLHTVSGTKGAAQKYPLPEDGTQGRISEGHEWLNATEFKKLEAKYQPEIIKRVGELAKKVGGHGGMDFLMDWRLIDCLRNGLPLDQDVYDAASWSVISPLSEWSVANRSNSIDIPDFTNGAWKKNRPVDITLNDGGNTGVKS
ncbi:Gfo/Idh/MocA family protein [Dyadobacter sp. CY343]|uniref:Gfo/Idh/MocA family protein n=1 Tax=Dyadobacter sp. CY343 TaxID=2907299 RepID=UPI001F370417|nr:Gfo/Idh/MocA family oxidoreductase [Dyadobacter sp. CY343]MCE7058437.1 Gfo/Idh/MocA family oxidoreductase [Dyadobacter sp. CY343]